MTLSTELSVIDSHQGLGNLMLPTGAAAFFKLLAQKPILPLKAFPFVVLFLIGGESNFDFWWSHSIAPALDYFGYKVGFLTTNYSVTSN